MSTAVVEEVAGAAGLIDYQGDPLTLFNAGERLRWGLSVAIQVGERDQVAQLAAALSRLVTAGGDPREGQQLAELAREYAPAEGVAAQAGWRAASAAVMAKRGRLVQVVELLEVAKDLTTPSLPNLRADLLCDLARALTADGDVKLARAATQEATTLYEQKGNLVGLALANSVNMP